MLRAIKKLLAMGIPIAATRFIHTFNTFIVMLFLAQLGHDVLAASYSIATIRVALIVIFMSPLFAIGAIVSRSFGNESLDNKGKMHLLVEAWLVALILSIIPIVIALFLKPILIFFRQPQELITITTSYFKYYMYALPAIYLAKVNQQYLFAIKQQKWVVIVNIVMMLLNIVLNYGFIFGKFYLPELGVPGAGIVGSITSWLYLGLSLLLLFRVSNLERCSLNLNLSWAKLILKVGGPISVSLTSDMLMMSAIMVMTGWLGALAMSANQVSNEYIRLAILPLFGLSEAASIVTGHTLAEKNKSSLKTLNRAALFITTLFTISVAIVFAIFHKQLVDAFVDFSSKDAAAIYKLALLLLGLRLGKMLINGPILIISGLLRGMYDTIFPMFSSIIIGWLGTLPLAYILAFTLKLGVAGIFIASIVSETILAIIMLSRWQFKLRNIDLTKLHQI